MGNWSTFTFTNHDISLGEKGACVMIHDRYNV